MGGGEGSPSVRVNILTAPLTTLFNRVLAGEYPDSWNEQPLTSIYKGKGDPSDPANYRPIQNQDALAKLYHIILQQRLDAFAEQQGLRAEGQAGFRRQRRTSDGVLVLRHLIDRTRLALPKQKKPLFCCFVDFKQAYDSVPRNKLFSFLASLGLHGNILTTLTSMYWNVRVRPKDANGLGAAIPCTRGVRQGDPLSPLLFGLYLDRLESYLSSRYPDVGPELGGQRLRTLLYADDTALLSHTPEGLQELLKGLSTFCNENGLTVNVAKTEIVLFGWNKNTPPTDHHTFTYNGKAVPISSSFKYLGVVFDQNKGVDTTPHLANSATRSIHLLNSHCK